MTHNEGNQASKAGAFGAALLALLAAVALLDAVVETVWSGSPIRWWVAPAVGLFIAVVLWLWRPGGALLRRVGPGAAAATLAGGLIALLALTAWLPGGQTDGVRMFGVPTATLMVAALGAAVALAVFAIVRGVALLSPTPRLVVRLVAAALGLYALAAIGLALGDRAGFSELFAGGALWQQLPRWLQGPFVGGLLVLPVAILVQLLRLFRNLRWKRPVGALLHQAAAMVLAVVMAAAGLAGGLDRSFPGGAVTGGPQAPGAPPPGTFGDWAERFKSMTPEESFAEVARIPFEPYLGVLRGARGTLVAGAGNGLDKSLLLATMLRAQGRQVRLVSGPLNADRAAALLRSAYPAQLPEPTWGPEFEPFDPGADPSLRAVVSDHTWVEFERDGSWVPADPSVPGAKLGEAFGEASARGEGPPSEAFHRVALTWKAATENNSVEQLGRIEGTVADLALQPLSLVVRAIPVRSSGKDAQPSGPTGAGGLLGGMFGAEEPAKPKPKEEESKEGPLVGVRYERELLLPDGATTGPPHVSDRRKRGSAIEREWLEGTVTGPGGFERRIERTLWTNASGARKDPVGEVRRYGVGIFPGRVTHQYLKARLEEARGPLAMDETKKKADALASRTSGDELEEAQKEAFEIERRLGSSAAWFLSLSFAAESDLVTERLAASANVTVVRGAPRIVISSIETVADRPVDARATIGLDLRLDEVRAYPWPGRPAQAAYLFQTARGEQESIIEGAVVKARTGRPALTTALVIQQAPVQGRRLLTVTPENRGDLAGIREMPRDVRDLVEQAVASGRHVIIPEAAVTVEGRPHWGWWDLDPQTGALVGVMEGGGHQATAEYSISLKEQGLDEDKGFALGMTVGAITTIWRLQAALLEYGEITPEVIKAVEEWVENGACNSMCPPKIEVGAQIEGSVAGDCLKPKQWKKEVMAKVTVAFCDEYHDGFKCAGGLILSWLKQQAPGFGLKAEIAINMPNCKEYGPKIEAGK